MGKESYQGQTAPQTILLKYSEEELQALAHVLQIAEFQISTAGPDSHEVEVFGQEDIDRMIRVSRELIVRATMNLNQVRKTDERVYFLDKQPKAA